MIRILTDSMSDLTQEDASRLGITVLPMPVSFGEEERWEGVDLSREEFFARLRVAEELPHTSQIAPRAWQKAFDRELRDNEDELLCITGSSGLTGGYQSALLARETLTLQTSYTPFAAVAVISAVPGASASTTPEPLTEATVRSELSQVTVRSVALVGSTVARSCTFSPTVGRSSVWLSVTDWGSTVAALTVTTQYAVNPEEEVTETVVFPAAFGVRRPLLTVTTEVFPDFQVRVSVVSSGSSVAVSWSVYPSSSVTSVRSSVRLVEGCFTVTTHVALMPVSDVAVTTAEPSLWPVTTPSSTVRMEGSLLLQLMLPV